MVAVHSPTPAQSQSSNLASETKYQEAKPVPSAVNEQLEDGAGSCEKRCWRCLDGPSNFISGDFCPAVYCMSCNWDNIPSIRYPVLAVPAVLPGASSTYGTSDSPGYK